MQINLLLFEMHFSGFFVLFVILSIKLLLLVTLSIFAPPTKTDPNKTVAERVSEQVAML